MPFAQRALLSPLVAGAALVMGCVDQGPSNNPPTADFAVACSGLTCQLTDSSTDVDGTIQSHGWIFGDGATSTEPDPVHTYAAPGGEFTVTLVVTDDDGDTATAAKPVTVEPGNALPVADFAVACVNLTCSFTDQSTDPDPGDSVASRAWDFGDGQTSAERNPTHTYAYPGGQFTVTLTVTDDNAAAATAARQIAVALADAPDRSGTYERVTPHQLAGRHTRYVLRPDGRFEYQDSTPAGDVHYFGRWAPACCWGGWAIEPGSVIIFTFDGISASQGGVSEPGVAYGAFLLDSHLGIAYNWVMIRNGFEEGVYSTDPRPGTPGPPPPQAGQIAFVRNGRIHVANTDGGGVVPVSAGPNDSAPAWSPDGTRIAFSRNSGDTTGIFIMDVDGGNVVQPTTSGDDPTWSPDGAWIAFTCRNVESDICVVRADGASTPPINVTQRGGVVAYAAWSPDGTRIAYTSDWAMFDLWFDIWVVSPDGSQQTALTTHTPADPNPYEHYQPAWSPNGRRIAFVLCYWAFTRCSSSAVSLINADGSGVVRLAAASGFASPTWSPDGQVIAYASSNAIEWVSADGNQRGRILDNGHSPAWRP